MDDDSKLYDSKIPSLLFSVVVFPKFRWLLLLVVYCFLAFTIDIRCSLGPVSNYNGVNNGQRVTRARGKDTVMVIYALSLANIIILCMCASLTRLTALKRKERETHFILLLAAREKEAIYRLFV